MNKESCLLTIDGHIVDAIRALIVQIILFSFCFFLKTNVIGHTLAKYELSYDNFVTLIEDRPT